MKPDPKAQKTATIIAVILYIIILTPIVLIIIGLSNKSGIDSRLPEKYHNTNWVCSEYGMEFSVDNEGFCYGTLNVSEKTADMHFIFDSTGRASVFIQQGNAWHHVFRGKYRIRGDEIRVFSGNWTDHPPVHLRILEQMPSEFVFVLE